LPLFVQMRSGSAMAGKSTERLMFG
jgi:hypothetical protein